MAPKDDEPDDRTPLRLVASSSIAGALQGVLHGQPMPLVIQAVLLLLGDVLHRARVLHAEYVAAGDTDRMKMWPGAQAEMLIILAAAKEILTAEDYDQAYRAYQLLGLPTGDRVN